VFRRAGGVRRIGVMLVHCNGGGSVEQDTWLQSQRMAVRSQAAWSLGWSGFALHFGCRF
jgi:hypothetical protein